MSKSGFFPNKTEQQLLDDEIRKTTRDVESFFLRNRKKMTEEDLTRELPRLQNKINPNNHSNAQFHSMLIFLEICCTCKAKLPENFRQYREPKVLYEAFLSLSKSHLFDKQTTSLEKGFINIQLEKNKPRLSVEKHEEEYKEEHKEEAYNPDIKKSIASPTKKF